MKKTKLKFWQALDLSLEISGNQTVKGLLNEKLPIKVKYWLGRLSEKLETHKESVEKLRVELVRKYGDEENGNFSIPYEKEGKSNPNFEKFHKDYNELLSEELEIEHTEFQLIDIESMETEFNYKQFMKLIE